MLLTIQTRFALDRNKTQTVEPEEVASLQDLAALDSDGDDFLKDGEFKGVYYEYGTDKWVPADRDYVDKREDYTIVVRMNHLNVKTGAIDVTATIR